VGSVRVAVNGAKVNGQADIWQYNDYYPFGSIAQSGGAGYRYDYQGAYSQKDGLTQWNNFDLRMYDGKIGRWLGVDPQGQFASPYEGIGNDPVTGADPTGGDVTDFYKNLSTGQIAWFSGSNAVKGYEDIGGDDMNFNGGDLGEVFIKSSYIYNWEGINPGVDNQGWRNNRFMFSNNELDNFAKKELLFLSLFMGGEIFAGADASFFSTRAIVGRAITSTTSQILSKRSFGKFDYADVGSDAFLPLGISSITDAEIDFTPFSPSNDPLLAIGGVNKPMSQVTFEATSNLIMGIAGGKDNNLATDILQNTGGQAFIDHIEQHANFKQ
jgi:RHS repeat-associated protein